jgi:hypothetical protein
VAGLIILIINSGGGGIGHTILLLLDTVLAAVALAAQPAGPAAAEAVTVLFEAARLTAVAAGGPVCVGIEGHGLAGEYVLDALEALGLVLLVVDAVRAGALVGAEPARHEALAVQLGAARLPAVALGAAGDDHAALPLEQCAALLVQQHPAAPVEVPLDEGQQALAALQLVPHCGR